MHLVFNKIIIFSVYFAKMENQEDADKILTNFFKVGLIKISQT